MTESSRNSNFDGSEVEMIARLVSVFYSRNDGQDNL